MKKKVQVQIIEGHEIFNQTIFSHLLLKITFNDKIRRYHLDILHLTT